ncbi:MAG: acetolactate decarboxylase [Nonlabens sp.]|uniref:acetolactate decarboxylase n=1 Tax=Nonlabens sp. TaxID=1888209 RepID=UPI003EFA8AFE
MKKFKFLLLLVLATSLTNCNDDNELNGKVQHRGALMNLMSGNLEATASLDSLQTLPHLYALGALENLKGEVQIFDSNSYVSKAGAANSVAIEADYDHNASLLVYAQVAEWTEPILLDEFTVNSQLEKQIKTAAFANGIDVEKPFPFLIKGKPSLLSWHVINWKDGDMVHSHKKHKESGSHGTFENEEVEIIGFYSEKHKAIFTHHTTFLHMHFKTEMEHPIAGHVDELKGKELNLYLPSI